MVYEWFVGNLARGVTEAEVIAFLQTESGAILVGEVRLVNNADGEPAGYGFARVDIPGDEDCAEGERRKLFGRELRGRRVNVEFARPRAKLPAFLQVRK